VFGENHTIENTLDLLHITHKGKHMNTIEKFRMHNLNRQNLTTATSLPTTQFSRQYLHKAKMQATKPQTL